MCRAECLAFRGGDGKQKPHRFAGFYYFILFCRILPLLPGMELISSPDRTYPARRCRAAGFSGKNAVLCQNDLEVRKRLKARPKVSLAVFLRARANDLNSSELSLVILSKCLCKTKFHSDIGWHKGKNQGYFIFKDFLLI